MLNIDFMLFVCNESISKNLQQTGVVNFPSFKNDFTSHSACCHDSISKHGHWCMVILSVRFYQVFLYFTVVCVTYYFRDLKLLTKHCNNSFYSVFLSAMKTRHLMQNTFALLLGQLKGVASVHTHTHISTHAHNRHTHTTGIPLGCSLCSTKLCISVPMTLTGRVGGSGLFLYPAKMTRQGM